MIQRIVHRRMRADTTARLTGFVRVWQSTVRPNPLISHSRTPPSQAVDYIPCLTSIDQVPPRRQLRYLAKPGLSTVSNHVWAVSRFRGRAQGTIVFNLIV